MMRSTEPILMRLTDLVSRITYKPGASFSVSLDPAPYQATGLVRLMVSMSMPDIHPPHGMTRICTHTVRELEWFDGATESLILRDWVYPCILQLEDHEIQEWLQVDGMQVFDPHPVLKISAF